MKKIVLTALLLGITGVLSAQTAFWEEKRDVYIRVFFHSGDEKNTADIIKAINDALPDLETKIGASFEHPELIYLTASQAEFDRITGGRLPDWSQGVSFPQTNSIVLKSPQFSHDVETCLRTSVHETAHLLIALRVGTNIPRWFNEGLALWFSGEGAGKPLIPLSRAIWSHRLIPLTDVEQVDGMSHDEAELAYLSSFHAVEYFIQQHGWGTLARLFEALSQGRYWNDALFQETELDQAGFEAAWRAHLEKSYRWMILLDTQLYLFAGMTSLVLIAGVLVYRRRRKIYQKWEAEETSSEGIF